MRPTLISESGTAFQIQHYTQAILATFVSAGGPLPRITRHYLVMALFANLRSQIIHNPGAIPDARYMGLCDVSVVFEGTYSTFQIYGFSKRISSFHAAAQTARGAAAVIIHSLPPNLSDDDQFELVRKAKELAGSIFVTGLSVDYYASFWDGWEGFIDDMNDTSS